ncbi:MAG: DMT family transporter [Pseudomonadota bacterium]
MNKLNNRQSKNHEQTADSIAYLLGFIGILGFSMVLPVTKIVVASLDPLLAGLGRSFILLIPAVLVLWFFKVPVPTKNELKAYFFIILGVIVGFPLLSAFSMKEVASGQGAIIISILPLFTAIAGAILMQQRPSWGFWLVSFIGAGLVLAFLLNHTGGRLVKGDYLLIIASIVCAFGYAEGAKMAKKINGGFVIAWAIVLSAPFTAIPIFITLPQQSWNLPNEVIWAFCYTSLIAQWLAFVFWYGGLARGGIVRVSQVQLLQPFLTFIGAAYFANESISLSMLLFAVAVTMTVFIGKKMPILEKSVIVKSIV